MTNCAGVMLFFTCYLDIADFVHIMSYFTFFGSKKGFIFCLHFIVVREFYRVMQNGVKLIYHCWSHSKDVVYVLNISLSSGSHCCALGCMHCVDITWNNVAPDSSDNCFALTSADACCMLVLLEQQYCIHAMHRVK